MRKRLPTRRGAYQRAQCTFIGAWIPKPMVEAIDAMVKARDLDRSKILRQAVSEKIGLDK
jgi:metal-responsive CopG/Arc/MetJ family transcriptional regulator